MKAGLIEDLIISRIPILLGRGRHCSARCQGTFGSTTSRPQRFLLVSSSRCIEFASDLEQNGAAAKQPVPDRNITTQQSWRSR